MEKRLDNIGDIYSTTVTLVKRLISYNLYDLQSIEETLGSFHRKWTAVKVKLKIKFYKNDVFYLCRPKFYEMKIFFIRVLLIVYHQDKLVKKWLYSWKQ